MPLLPQTLAPYAPFTGWEITSFSPASDGGLVNAGMSNFAKRLF